MRMRRFHMSMGHKFSTSALLLLCALNTGCSHQPLHVTTSYRLEGVPEYPYLIPSLPSSADADDFQTSLVHFSGAAPTTSIPVGKQCSITGPVFSLQPAGSSDPTQWLVKSPSLQRWQKLDSEVDFKAQWNNFVHALLQMQSSGCFPPRESISSITRSIAEVMPIQADETLFYFYGFGGTGFVDLAPGMQMKVEETVTGTGDKDSATTRYAQYEVLQISDTETALRLVKQSDHPATESLGDKNSSVFGLQSRFSTKPILRLFLESSMHDGPRRSAMLVGSTNALDLNNATRQIQESSFSSCPTTITASTDCVLFKKRIAVSLLLPIWVNGKLVYRPIGTPLGYILDMLPDNEKSRAIETVSLLRPIGKEHYANVEFPRNLESTQHIVLLNGDRITWKH
jgi:hypothetical protein